jgi:pyruvate carboxylase
MYPQVFLDYVKKAEEYGEVSILDTPAFFYGIRLGETIEVQIERGKTLIVRLDEIGEPTIEGKRTLFFNLNGQRREIVVQDKNIKTNVLVKKKAEPTNREHIGATMSGSVLKVLVKKGDIVKKDAPLIITEAMKMETSITAPFDCVVEQVYVTENEPVSSNDLLLELKEQ